MKGLSWVNFVLGLWLIVAPFVLQFRDVSHALWNSVIVGIIIAIIAIWRALEHTDMTPLEHRPSTR